jgi:periplasmic divalent cation tolerance protein
MGGTSTTPVMLYTTLPNTQLAQQIAQDLVSKRLVACANILPASTSIYQWKGMVESASEVAILCKTTLHHTEAARIRIRALHPYETPCIVWWELAGGDAAFLQWIHDETAKKD